MTCVRPNLIAVHHAHLPLSTRSLYTVPVQPKRSAGEVEDGDMTYRRAHCKILGMTKRIARTTGNVYITTMTRSALTQAEAHRHSQLPSAFNETLSMDIKVFLSVLETRRFNASLAAIGSRRGTRVRPRRDRKRRCRFDGMVLD